MSKLKHQLGKIMKSEYAVMVLLLVIFACLAMTTPLFLTGSNILNIINRTAATGMVAIGMTFVICTGGIDLSVGGQVTLISVVGTFLMMGGMNPWIALILMLVMGVAIGAFNGLFVSYLKLPAFMVTLAVMNITNGVAYFLTSGRTYYEIPDDFIQISMADVGGIPLPVIYLIVFAVIAQLVLKRFTLGRRIMALGGNAKGAWFAGVNVKANTLFAYMISGVMCGVASVLMVSRLMAVSATIGDGMEMDAIAASVLGGTALTGGRGNIIGPLAGAIILMSIDNWMNLISVDNFLREAVKGLIILLGMVFDAWRKGDFSRNKLREV